MTELLAPVPLVHLESLEASGRRAAVFGTRSIDTFERLDREGAADTPVMIYASHTDVAFVPAATWSARYECWAHASAMDLCRRRGDTIGRRRRARKTTRPGAGTATTESSTCVDSRRVNSWASEHFVRTRPASDLPTTSCPRARSSSAGLGVSSKGTALAAMNGFRVWGGIRDHEPTRTMAWRPPCGYAPLPARQRRREGHAVPLPKLRASDGEICGADTRVKLKPTTCRADISYLK